MTRNSSLDTSLTSKVMAADRTNAASLAHRSQRIIIQTWCEHRTCRTHADRQRSHAAPWAPGPPMQASSQVQGKPNGAPPTPPQLPTSQASQGNIALYCDFTTNGENVQTAIYIHIPVLRLYFHPSIRHSPAQFLGTKKECGCLRCWLSEIPWAVDYICLVITTAISLTFMMAKLKHVTFSMPRGESHHAALLSAVYVAKRPRHRTRAVSASRPSYLLVCSHLGILSAN